ncbi:hypothetical protein [Humibacter sp. RRB41]|uniref:hypothetical protein n=1 Tax=Humibacter sp. RRB41 TaxID=2919946 RepID=UPI001FA963B6|nr:hypothetical protein [Humibacter sp. RRB41]
MPLSRHRLLTIATLSTIAVIGCSLALGAAPASAEAAGAWSTSPAQLFVGETVDAQIEFDIPSDAAPEELPTSISFAAVSDADPSATAVAFDIASTTPNLSGCTIDAGGSAGSCQWDGAAPGDSAVITVHETGVSGPFGVQHLTFSQTLADGTGGAAGFQDMTVIPNPLSESVSLSADTVAVGGTATLSATFVLAAGTPAEYLPSYVGLYARQDPNAGLGALRFTIQSFAGASSCQVEPGGRGFECALSDPAPGDTITVTAVVTATTAPAGDNPAPSPLGPQYLFFSYGGPNLIGRNDKSDQVIDAVAGSGTTPTDPASPVAGTTLVAGSSASDPRDAAALADTGSDTAPGLAVAALFVFGGAAALVVTARRRRHARS